MTDHPGDLEARVEALESQVDEVTGQLEHARQDATAARVLAGGADRDVGEIGTEMRDLHGEMHDFRQVTIASFNAMRDDYVDLRSRVDGGFSRVDDGFTEIRGRLDTTAAGLTHITDLLDELVAGRKAD